MRERNAPGRRGGGAVKEESRRARSELRLLIEHGVARVLEESKSIAEATPQIIRVMCEALGWTCGARWELDKGTRGMQCAETWGVRSAHVDAFLDATRRLAPSAQSGGLNRRTQAERRPVWTRDITKDPSFRRAPEAANAGLHSAFAFPIKVDARVVGVMEFFSREIHEPDPELLECTTYIGTQMGQFLERKRAEEEQRRFRLALDNSVDMILLIDRKTMRYVDVNQTACKLLGYSREELLAMGPKDLLPEGRGDMTQAHDELIANPSSPSGMRSHFRCKDGSTIPFESVRHVLRSGESHIIAAVCRDIRERLAAEEAQRNQADLIAQSAEKDRLLRLFYELPFVGLAVTSPTSKRWLQVNDYMCEMLGYPREELVQLAWTETTHPDDLPQNLALFQRLSAGEFDSFQFDKRFVRKDGRIVDTTMEVRCVRRGDGSVETVVIMVRDISERKRAEQLQTIEYAVTRCLAEANSVNEALKSVMRIVCETLGWECGRYFRKDDAAGLFRFAEAWYKPSPAMERFVAYSAERTFAPGSGIVGRAGAGEPQWVADVTKDSRVVHQMMAGDHDMRGAFMFPVMWGGASLGVLSFTSREIREPDERLLQAVRIIGAQIGQFLQRKKAEEVVRESEERFRSLTELSSDMYWEQDEQFRFTSMSGTGSERVNLKTIPAIGKKRWEQNYVNITADQWAAHITLLEAHKEFRDMELCRVDESGRRTWISISGGPVFDASGTFKGYRGVGKDITDRKQDEERIQFLANHDALTSLPNRAMFGDVLHLAIQNAQRYSRSFAVLFIDLDRFKNINDTLGHDAGDKLLQEMGKRLGETVRASDVVARLGGDEFVVLVQEVREAKQVAAVARKLLSALVHPMIIQGQECRVTASIGICMFPAEAQDELALMKNADIAMYHAKEDGKNTYKFYTEEMNVHSFERLALETSLRRGLERGEFVLHYQAKLDLHAGNISGVEALVRWQHPEMGMVPPAQFIPLAEETGLIVPIGRWVLQTACEQSVAWQRQGLPAVCMAVNLSARQFADDDLLEDIAAVLKSTGLRPDLLELELTESMVIQNTERAGRVLGEIKKMGVRLAIDDFGVGYSSLTHLKRFPIDTLKVDRSFIRDLPQDLEDKAITQAIVAMGKSLNLTVIAEGVETQEQQTFLRDLDCDEMQGFFFSKPIAGDAFAELLRQHVREAPQ